MKVLVACEESQEVCKAFRAKGHEAYSCDIIECSGGKPEWHIMTDALLLLDGNCEFITCDGILHKIVGKWDMIIAFPPCTYLTAASAVRMYPKKGVIDDNRYKEAMKAKAFFLAIYCAKCDKIAIENPTPLKVVNLPKYAQVIQPYEYGHPYSKRTCLWLKNLPRLVPTEIISQYTPYVNAGSKKADGTYRNKQGVARNQKERSKTFPGIAKAMAEQWG